MCVCAREYSWTHTLSHRHVLTRAVWERGDGSGTSFSEEANSVNTGLKWNLRPLSDGRGKSVWACLMRPWSVWDIVRVYETHHICMSSRAGGLGLACAGRFSLEEPHPQSGAGFCLLFLLLFCLLKNTPIISIIVKKFFQSGRVSSSSTAIIK